MKCIPQANLMYCYTCMSRDLQHYFGMFVSGPEVMAFTISSWKSLRRKYHISRYMLKYAYDMYRLDLLYFKLITYAHLNG